MQQLHPELDKLESEWVMQDPRVAWLEAQLKSLRPKRYWSYVLTKRPPWRWSIICTLKQGCGAPLHEALSLIERDRAAAYFAEEPAERRR